VKTKFVIDVSGVLEFAAAESVVYASGEGKRFLLTLKAGNIHTKPFVVENLKTKEKNEFQFLDQAVDFFNNLKVE